jgi:hypothetical protein
MLELGAPERAELAIRESLAAAARMGLIDSIPMMTQNLSLALARQGKLDAARGEAEEAVRANRAIGNRRMQAASQNYLAMILMLAGDLAGAEQTARGAAEAARDVAWSVRGHALGVLARALLAGGHVAPALSAAREAMAVVDSRGRLEEGEAFVRLVHAEALAAAGEHEAAKDALAAARRRLLARAGRIRDPAWRASFLERVPENARTLELDLG